jgi:hypothetical protein
VPETPGVSTARPDGQQGSQHGDQGRAESPADQQQEDGQEHKVVRGPVPPGVPDRPPADSQRDGHGEDAGDQEDGHHGHGRLAVERGEGRRTRPRLEHPSRRGHRTLTDFAYRVLDPGERGE